MPRASISSSITHRCVVLLFATLFLLSLPFNYYCGYDYLWFRLFINSVLAYVHVPHIYCLMICLNWYFVNWGLNVQGCFTHILNIHKTSCVIVCVADNYCMEGVWIGYLFYFSLVECMDHFFFYKCVEINVLFKCEVLIM